MHFEAPMISVGSNLLYEEPDPDDDDDDDDDEGRKMAKEHLSTLFKTTLANLRMYSNDNPLLSILLEKF